MAAKIIAQTFGSGSWIRVHPRFVGVLPRGISRRVTYKVDRMYFNGGSYRVVFHDRDGFVRDLPLALFVDITPAWVDGWEPQSVRNHTRYVRA